MSDFTKKNNDEVTARIVLSAEQVEPLLQSERWCDKSRENGCGSGEKVVKQGSAVAVNSVVEELCVRPLLECKEIDIERLVKLTSADLIDRFLSTEHHRIVAQEGEPDSEIVVEPEFEDEEDMVSEELAEVYLAQGLKDMAKETYRKLSLVNPEKSVYFAELIEKIDKNE